MKENDIHRESHREVTSKHIPPYTICINRYSGKYSIRNQNELFWTGPTNFNWVGENNESEIWEVGTREEAEIAVNKWFSNPTENTGYELEYGSPQDIRRRPVIYNLDAVLKELKFGRTAFDQEVIQKAIDDWVANVERPNLH